MTEIVAEQLPGILAVLESAFPSHGGGGAESQVRTLGLEFLSRGHGYEVIVPMVAGGPQGRVGRVDGIPVTRISYPKVHWIGGAWLLVRLAWLLIARRHRYEVIHAHIAGNMAAVSSLVGRLLGKTVVVKLTGMTEMRGGILDPARPWASRARRWSLRWSSALQATSRRIATALVEQGFDPAKVLSLPNAVDTLRFANLPRDPELRQALCGARSLVGIFVGRLEPEKGLDVLVEAWARAFEGRRDVALLIVGDGSRRQQLQLRAGALHVGDQLVFTGASDQVERYLAIADFALLTSQFEGLSNALLEYMAAGLPVVGSRISGTEDWVVDGQTGWLFEPGDVRALGRVLAEVHGGGEAELRRRGAMARDRVQRLASIHAVVGQLQATFRELGHSHG